MSGRQLYVCGCTQEPEELFETVTQCLMSGADRDALSGWGAIVYVMCAHTTAVSPVPYLVTFQSKGQSFWLRPVHPAPILGHKETLRERKKHAFAGRDLPCAR